MDYATVITLCRLCATQNIDSNSVENLSLAENPDRKILLSLVNKYLRISVTDCESIPPKFCAECIQKLHSFDTFSRRCHEVQEMFNFLSNSTPFNELGVFERSTKLSEDIDLTENKNENVDDGKKSCATRKRSKTSPQIPPIRIKAIKQKKTAATPVNGGNSHESSNTCYEIKKIINEFTLVKENTRAHAKPQESEKRSDDDDDDADGYFSDDASASSDGAKDEQKVFKKNPFSIFEYVVG